MDENKTNPLITFILCLLGVNAKILPDPISQGTVFDKKRQRNGRKTRGKPFVSTQSQRKTPGQSNRK